MIIYHKTFTYPKCKWIVECKTGQKVKEKCTEDDRLVRKCKKVLKKVDYILLMHADIKKQRTHTQT